jgi:glycosyltransferase involved in cell wall biosynthesis
MGTQELVVSTQRPRVSIGLPVYNGEAFLNEALDSLLAQSYTDFELVISDNASTDRTEAICRERAAGDARIRYVRQDINVGASRNFNRVFELSRGEYFKWAAHDDLQEPDFLKACVEVLDANPDVVLVYPLARDLDEAGNTLKVIGMGLDADTPSASRRFAEFIRREHSCIAIFGVVRADVLRRTRLLGTYADCDRVLLAEIALAGRAREIHEPYFIHRLHGRRSVWQYRSRQTRSEWFDPSRGGRPAWPFTRQFLGCVGAVRRARLTPAEKIACTFWFVGCVGN